MPVGGGLRSETSRPLNVQACLRATLAGALAGLVGGSYRWVLNRIEPWRHALIDRLGGSLVGWAELAAVFAIGAGLARWLTVRFAPEAAGSGIQHVEERLASGGELRWKRLLPVKYVAGVLALAAGLSLGREGPTVHLGAGLATALQGRLGALPRRALLAALAGFEAMRPLPKPLRAAAVGVFAAVVARWLPAAIGNGEPMAQALIQAPPSPLGGLVLLLAVKLVLTLVSYGCGVPGGIFAPQLGLGATLGAIFHTLAPHVAGGTLGPALATAGMVGVFSASVRAPLTGLVLIAELTHHSQLLLPQAVAALAAYLMAAALRDRPIYEALRERDDRNAATATI